MSKRLKTPLRANDSALPEQNEPKSWGAITVRLAQSLGPEAFLGALAIGAFVYFGVKDVGSHGFALAVIWSLYVFRKLD